MVEIPSSAIVIDAGNSVIKFKTGVGEDAFPHALHQLSEAEYKAILTKTGKNVSIDYVRVNGKPYVVGERAESFSPTRITGPIRYRPDYYGIFVAACLVRGYKTNRDVALFASHPSSDTMYRPDLAAAAWGDWCVEWGDQTFRFNVAYVNMFDEPVGGLMNVILSDSGSRYARTDINDGKALVIDIGGGTTDFQGVLPGGELDYSVSFSIPVGIREVEINFSHALRTRYAKEFAGLKSLPIDRVREGIASGYFTGGGRQYSCEAEARETTGDVIKRIIDAYQERAYGALRWDHIVLTGGGSAMLEPKLRPRLEHDNIILAETPQAMHLANVRGGSKLYKLYKSQGWL